MQHERKEIQNNQKQIQWVIWAHNICTDEGVKIMFSLPEINFWDTANLIFPVTKTVINSILCIYLTARDNMLFLHHLCVFVWKWKLFYYSVCVCAELYVELQCVYKL